MATSVKSHVVAVGLLLPIAPFAATARLTEVSPPTPELDLNRASLPEMLTPLGIEEGRLGNLLPLDRICR